MRDFWKPMPVSGKLVRELLLLFLLISMKVMQLPFLHIYFLHKKVFHEKGSSQILVQSPIFYMKEQYF